jgi:hypothetical protein
MAKWSVYRNRTGNLNLSYGSRLYDKTFDCGEIRNDTPLNTVVDWAINQGGIAPFDIIVWRGCPLFVMLPEGTFA